MWCEKCDEEFYYGNTCRCGHVLGHVQRPAANHGWDASDVNMMKGLVLFGEESKIFKNAPQDCQDAARALKAKWQPIKHDMPRVSEREINDEAL